LRWCGPQDDDRQISEARKLFSLQEIYMTPEFVTISNLIIDDIVLADGRSFMNTLGGAGTHTLVGMRPWSDALGFVAYSGDDLDPKHRSFLDAMDVDLRGVVRRPGQRTPRAWQLFEFDERRIEIFRTNLADFDRLKPQFGEIPPDYLQARGFHLQWGSPAELAQLIAQLQLHVKGMLAPYEYPKEIEFIDALPMTTTGKVQRRVLRLREEEKARVNP